MDAFAACRVGLCSIEASIESVQIFVVENFPPATWNVLADDETLPPIDDSFSGVKRPTSGGGGETKSGPTAQPLNPAKRQTRPTPRRVEGDDERTLSWGVFRHQ